MRCKGLDFHLLAIGFTALAFAGLAPAATDPLRSTALRKVEPTLQLTARAHDRIAGKLDGTWSPVRFQARATDLRHALASVDSARLHVEAEIDVAEGVAVLDGRGQVSLEDRKNFETLARELERRLEPPTGELALHERLLYRMALLFSEAPVGLSLGHLEISAADGVEGASLLQTCQQADNDGVTYLSGSCGVGVHQVCGDTSTECFGCDALHTGCDPAFDCLGRCGAGCGNGGRGWYTQDCADHDRCCASIGGCDNVFRLDCSDEFVELIDDILFGWFQSNCAGGC